MEEDEDVILEGTSLHEHLKELGFTDYEVVSSCSKRNALMKEMCPVIPKQDKKMCVLNETCSYVRKGISVITGWNDLEKSLLSLMSLRVTEAKILEEEDLMILETLSPAMQKLSLILLQDKEFDDLQFKLSSWKFILEIFQKLYLWFVLTSVLVIQHYVFDLSSLFGLMLFIVILGAVMFIRIAALWIFKRNLCKFYEFQSVVLKANQISLKCLRFINEVNILKKGTNYAELNLLECCYEKSLYEALHLLLNSLTSLLQSTCSEMRQTNIEHAEGVHSLFHRRYDVRGPQECTVGDENTFHVLKDKRNGVSMLSSAFLTEFLLCFEMCGSFSLFELIPSSNLTSVKKEIESLEKILNLSKKIWLEEEPNLKVVLNKPKSYERLKVDVSGAVDTLSVKCRILAYSCVQLQELVTTVELQGADLSLDDIQQSCEDIKNKILSCNASLEEVVERTDNLLAQKVGDMQRNLYINTGTENIEDATVNFAKTLAPTENLKEIQPPVIEDEVFEAVADHQLHSLEGDKLLFETLKKEKQIKKKQKERCRRVLQEIQPILQKRRKLWEERETKAINRMKQKQANENSPSETSTSEISPSGISPSGDSGINSPVINFIPDARSKENILHSASESVTPDKEMNFSIPRKVFCSSHDYDVEYDSEEERLELYRRVRKELDEDEARRKMEDRDCDTDSEEETFCLRRRARKDLSNDETTSKNEDDLNKFDSDSEYEEISSINLSQRKSLFTLPLKTLEDSSVEGKLFQNFENKSLTKNRNIIHGDLDKNNLIRLRDDDAILKIKQNSVSSSLQNSMTFLSIDTEDTISKISSRETDSNLHLIHDDENSYSCGDSSDENERVLDWSSCGFSARRPEVDEDIKVMPFSGVSTMLTLALTRPPPQGGEEEVFGGVGEGESDSEDSVTSDEPADLA